MVNINLKFIFQFIYLFVYISNCSYFLTRKLLNIHCALGLIEWNRWFQTIPNIDNTNILFLYNFSYLIPLWTF
jgi:hypothetical protein